MKCDNFLLEGYVDDYLTIGERREVEKHILSCANCQAELVRIEKEQQDIQSDMQVPSLTKSFADDIMNKIEQSQKPKKKRAWHIPLTVAATAMLAIGLVALNKEVIFNETAITQKQQQQIVFEDVKVGAGEAEISLYIEDADGNRIKPSEIADVKVFYNGYQSFDITDYVHILTTSDENSARYVIQLDDMFYDQLKVVFHFKEANIEKQLELDMSNIISTTDVGPLTVSMQGRRLKNDIHEIFYKLNFNEEYFKKYDDIQQEKNRLYQLNEQLATIPSISYELFDVNGDMLIGERTTTDFEGSGIGSIGSGGDEIGEAFQTLQVPERFGHFPLKMRIKALQYSYPTNEVISVPVGKKTIADIDGHTYEIDVQKENDTTIYAEIKSTEAGQQGFTKILLKPNNRFTLGDDHVGDYGENSYYYRTSTTLIEGEPFPTTIDLLFAEKTTDIQLDKPIEIVID